MFLHKSSKSKIKSKWAKILENYSNNNNKRPSKLK